MPTSAAEALGRPPDPYERSIPGYHRFSSVLVGDLLNRSLRKELAVDEAYQLSAVAHEGVRDTLAIFFDLAQPTREEGSIAQSSNPGGTPALWVDAFLPSPLHGRGRAAEVQAAFGRLRPRLGDEYWLFGTAMLQDQRVLISSPGREGKLLAHIVRSSGLTPPMNDACAALAEIDEEVALRSHGITREKLDGARQSTSFERPEQLFGTRAWRQFSGCFRAPPHSHSLDARALLGHADYLLLRALREVRMPQDGKARVQVSGAFERIAELLEAYRRSHPSTPRQYALTHELIHEELRHVLDIIRPYGRQAFAALFLKQTRVGRRGRRDVEAPRVFAFNSGMACIDALLRALVEVRGRIPSIAVLGPTHFEVDETIQLMQKL